MMRPEDRKVDEAELRELALTYAQVDIFRPPQEFTHESLEEFVLDGDDP